MDVIDYWFGDGSGPVTHWQSPSRDGAVPLDFDGDGRVDDAMLDLDADGHADVAALDLDDDGIPESRFRDDGTGVWALVPEHSQTPGVSEPPGAVDAPSAGTGAPQQCQVPRPGPEQSAAEPGTAATDAPQIRPLGAEPGQPPRQALIDTDHDGQPDVLVFDTDGDGTADGAVHPQPPNPG